MVLTETTYADLLESDFFPETDEYLFQTVILRPTSLCRYAYEHSVDPRDKRTYKSTPVGRHWGNVWDAIHNNQARAPGKRRNRYHIFKDSREVIIPAAGKYVSVEEMVKNPFGGEPLAFTRGEWESTPAVHRKVELIYIDIDDMEMVDPFLTLPNAIWARSPSGRCHLFVMIQPAAHERVRETLRAWFNHHHVTAENNIIAITGRHFKKCLTSILIPGQDEWTLPCEPGQPDKPIVKDYEETIALFAEHYRNHRLRLEEAFPICREKSTSVSKTQEPQNFAEKAKTAEPVKATPHPAPIRNRPRLGGSCNIPGIKGPITITRNRGTTFEQHYEYRTIDDCLDEDDGFHIGWAYFAALTRKHQGDVETAQEEFVRNRQSLRTAASKKHRHTLLMHHARAMRTYAERTYDPTKMKHSERNRQDAHAMRDVARIDPHHLATVIQQELRQHRLSIIKDHGLKAYQAAQDCIHAFTEDCQRNNGRIAQRSKKSREEYVFADSRVMLDYPGINGSKRLLTHVVKILKQYAIAVGDESDWSEAKCTRWTYQEHILVEAKNLQDNQVQSLECEEEAIGTVSLTNVGPHMSTWTAPKDPGEAVFETIDGILSDLGSDLWETCLI